MSPPTFDTFQQQAVSEGFDEIIIREWAPQLHLDTHTHPFHVSAYVARGEYWLTTADGVRHLKAGDSFRLARNVPHAELYGPEGATVWVARANGLAKPLIRDAKSLAQDAYAAEPAGLCTPMGPARAQDMKAQLINGAQSALGRPNGLQGQRQVIPQHAQNITRLITHLKDKLGVENTDLMGHSYGSVSSSMDMGQQAHAPWIFVHNLNDQCKSSPYAPSRPWRVPGGSLYAEEHPVVTHAEGAFPLLPRSGTGGTPCGGGLDHKPSGHPITGEPGPGKKSRYSLAAAAFDLEARPRVELG